MREGEGESPFEVDEALEGRGQRWTVEEESREGEAGRAQAVAWQKEEFLEEWKGLGGGGHGEETCEVELCTVAVQTRCCLGNFAVLRFSRRRVAEVLRGAGDRLTAQVVLFVFGFVLARVGVRVRRRG